MKILILNGSPRKKGETAALVQAVKERLQGEIEEIFAFEQTIHPCVDCRYCRAHPDCAIADGWQVLQEKIYHADGILIASPVWFGSLPGPLLSMLSRLQSSFSAEFFRKEAESGASKKGALLLTAGSTGGAEGAIQTARILLRQMKAEDIYPAVCSLQTDSIPAAEDDKALAEAAKIAEFFNKSLR